MWPFGRRVEERTTSWPLEVLTGEPSGEGSGNYSHVTVTPDTALRHAAVWACVRLIADTVSGLPVDAYRTGGRKPLAARPRLLDEPAAGTGFPEWTYAVLVSALTRGNAFGLVVDRAGVAELPTQIELVDTGRVSVSTGGDGRIAWRLDGREIDRADLWHFRAYPVAGSPFGLSPVDYAKKSIGLGLAAEAYGSTFFSDGATPSGLLTSDQSLTKDAAENQAAMWRQAHQGRRKTAVLGQGTKWQQISIAPDESQFLDTQRFTVQQVCRVYGVPPEMIGADSGNSLTYANVEQRSLDFLAYCIGPWLARLERALTALVPRGTYVKYNAGALLRTDLLTRYQSYEIGLRAGFITVDEVRELEDREPLPAAATPAAPPQLGAVA